MWERIKPETLEIGKEYQVMDNQKFVVNAILQSDCFVNSVTKAKIINPTRVWI